MMVALGVGCSSTSTEDGDTGSEEKTAVDVEAIIGGTKTTAYPGAALLSMRTAAGAGYACTATVIAPKVVLTAGHCVDGMASFEVFAGGSYRTSTKGETYDWKENGATSVNPSHHDIGLIYLSEPIVLPSYPTLAERKAPDGTAAVDVGRIRNGAVTNDIYSAPISVSDAAKVGYAFDYVATGVIEHGDSGGAVFAGNTQQIIAVNSGAGGSVEVLARVDLLREWILARISPTTPAPAPSSPTDAGVDARADAHVDAAAPAPAPAPATCAASEAEPNDEPARANALRTSVCGKTSTASDVDWYVYTATVGQTVLTLGGDADVSASVGYLSGGRCVNVVSNARVAAVKVAAGSMTVCIGVSSPSHKLQSYRLVATH